MPTTIDGRKKHTVCVPNVDALPIPLYPDYMVDPLGNIYSKRIDGRHWRQLKPKKHSAGYRQVTLSNDCFAMMFFVHRIVAKVFCKGERIGWTVNHKDLNKANNHASNLEWVTFRDNQRHWRRENPQALHRQTTMLRERLRKGCIAVNPDDPNERMGFDSIVQAAIWLGDKERAGNVCHAIKSGRVAYDWLWFYEH